jgi:ElaB/YqjD/DUF883 family membrane-anchored ribosome-binding protein
MASSNQTDKLAQSVSSTLSEMGDKSKAVTEDAIEKATAATSQFGAGLADTLRQGAETQKNAGADAVTALARSARNAADDLENRSPEAARLVRSSANAVERVSTDLRNQSLADLVDATSNFAVRHPVAFFGCGVLAGFVAARLLSPSQR